MSMAAIPGQIRARKLLWKMVEGARVPHGLLFTGEAGIGKSRTARAFAQLLNCTEPRQGDSCDRCPSCRKIGSGQHPDLLWVKKDGTFIKIDQVRQIKERLKFRPFEARHRVVVVEGAHDLKEEAANAFLKILEEPPRQNVLILITMEPRMLLPTLVSRCCHIRFQPLEEDLIARALIEEEGVERNAALEAARLASGSLARARLLADPAVLAHHREIGDRLRALAGMSVLELFSLTARWAREAKSLDEDLECIKLWLRDMIHSRLSLGLSSSREGGPRSSTADPSDDLDDRLFRLFDRIEQAHQQLRLNANRQLVLEGVCLAMRKAFDGESHRCTV
jgi:DNA polymerase-3 subunit delta'